ncbi:MAG: porin [Zoogloeaceae bacterium]|nr:porin [Zoogloeaceae bacterium]MCP5253145.1 porin [Zoogloeaceae bacterium]MCP5293402.1 porin [Zoogloeaceae bacterium]
MRKSLVTLSVLAALPFVSAAPAMAQGSPHSVSANVGFVSDYAYRGISQTNENMAIQGGFDYAHASGLYAGVWGSSIDWLDKGGVEADVYGGYKAEMGDFGYDVGVLHYAYPGGEIGGESPDTTEVYLGASWKFVSFKFSHAFSDLFGTPDSDGSQYYELGASYDVGAGFTAAAHFGRQKIKHGTSYNDWKIGISKEYAGFGFGLAYIDTDLDDSDDNVDERIVFSVSKSF